MGSLRIAPFHRRIRSLSEESHLRRSGEIPAILGIETGAISTSKSISEERGKRANRGSGGGGKNGASDCQRSVGNSVRREGALKEEQRV